MIRDVQPSDARPIAEIYNHYVSETAVSFEENPVSVPEMESRIAKISTAGFPFLVHVDERDHARGYAYADKWKARSAYRYCAEVSVYLAPENSGEGLGTQLYTALFQRLKSCDIRVVMGVITLPNPASVALHERFGMTKAAHFKNVGFKFGEWIDVGYWQGLLEQ